MNRLYIAVFDTSDLVFWGLLVGMVVAFAAMVGYAAGRNAGIRAEAAAAAQRDAADMADAAAEFGPLATRLVSRPGDSATLRRIK